MASYGMWDLGSGGPNMDIWDWDGIIWGTGMDGALWDLGFGVGWPNGGHMGPGWENMGLRDEWGPTGSGIWGRVALKWRYGVRDECDPIRSGIWGWVAQRWTYGAQGWMGPYGIWDLGSDG